MTITDIIEKHRIKLEDVPLEELRVEDYDEIPKLKGRLAERMVFIWLNNCVHKSEELNFDYQIPRTANGFLLKKRNESGVVVTKNKIEVHEFDSLIKYKSRPFIVEVKSLKLNGIETKMQRGISIASEIYNQEPGVLLFFPAYHNKMRDAEHLESKFRNLKCIDLGYKKKTIETVMRTYYKIHKPLFK